MEPPFIQKEEKLVEGGINMSGGLNKAYWSLIQKRAHVGGVSCTGQS